LQEKRFIGTARGARSHISLAPFAPLGSGALLASAWVGRLPANFNACPALLCGWRLGAGSRQPQASSPQ